MQTLLNKMTRAAFLASGLVSMVACAPDTGVGQFYREAGSQIDSGAFGNATLHNKLAQTCNQGGTSGGGKVGGQAGDPLVVLDPNSTAKRPVYRVYCSGRLDGKFASVVYGEYLASATPTSEVREANSE